MFTEFAMSFDTRRQSRDGQGLGELG